jgi:hypothetical protein
MMHKDDEGMRSHYLTIQFSINDAPAADEIVVALGHPSADVRIIASAIVIRTCRSLAAMKPEHAPLIPLMAGTVDGTAFSVHGTGEPLVLVHGVGMGKEIWTPRLPRSAGLSGDCLRHAGAW